MNLSVSGPSKDQWDEQTTGAMMNMIRSSYLCLLLGSVLATQALADTSSQAGWVAQNTLSPNSAPADNTIRRINPNSRQGTGASVPGASGPGIAPAVQPQGIDSGKIGNGYPRNPPVPPTIKPTAPSLQPRDKP